MTRRYGLGSIYRRSSDGLWVGAVRAGGKRRFVYGQSKGSVRTRIDEIRMADKQGLTPVDLRLTMGRHLAMWLESVRANVRPSTWESYEIHVRIHLASLAAVPLGSLTPNHVRKLVQERLTERCAPRTVAYTLGVLRMALKQAMRDGLVPRNVAEFVDPPRSRRIEVRIPTNRDARALLGLDTPLAPLWTLLLGTGLRLGEALGLRWSDVDLEDGTLTVRLALRPIPRHARPDAPKWARTGQRLQLVEPKTSASRRTMAIPTFVE